MNRQPSLTAEECSPCVQEGRLTRRGLLKVSGVLSAATILSPIALGSLAFGEEIRGPGDFRLPPNCVYVALPKRSGPNGLDWMVNLGTQGNQAARGVLGPALSSQGWTYLRHGLATASWAKSGLLVTVCEGSGQSGNYPRLVAHPATARDLQTTR